MKTNALATLGRLATCHRWSRDARDYSRIVLNENLLFLLNSPSCSWKPARSPAVIAAETAAREAAIAEAADHRAADAAAPAQAAGAAVAPAQAAGAAEEELRPEAAAEAAVVE